MALPSPRVVITALIDSLAPPTEAQHDNSAVPEGNHTTGSTSENLRKAFLTLQVLFPNELLPALDLLDRGLVTRLRPPPPPPNVAAASSHILIRPSDEDATGEQWHRESSDPTASRQSVQTTYLVRSSQNANLPYGSRHSNSTYHNTSNASDLNATKTYIVHLTSWSCSCPAFAFAAFPAASSVNGSALSVETETSAPSLLQHSSFAPSSRAGPSETRATADAATAGEKVPLTWRVGGLTRGQDVPMCKHLLACVLAEVSRGGGSDSFPGEVEERVISAEELAGWAAGWGD